MIESYAGMSSAYMQQIGDLSLGKQWKSVDMLFSWALYPELRHSNWSTRELGASRLYEDALPS
jgi:hypothetical protein